MTVGPMRMDEQPDLLAALSDRGIEAVLLAREADLDGIRQEETPEIALIDASAMPWAELKDCLRRCSELKLPVIALVSKLQVGDVDAELGADDFVVSPPPSEELVARARRVLARTGSPDPDDVVRAGDLVINATKYEVSVKGRRANLRFKEYELLILMAVNPGRVYSRETLLNRIWGYDYLGGTRTVDVHVRRLRSKIEDADHSFIETVWNVGYRFKDTGGGS